MNKHTSPLRSSVAISTCSRASALQAGCWARQSRSARCAAYHSPPVCRVSALSFSLSVCYPQAGRWGRRTRSARCAARASAACWTSAPPCAPAPRSRRVILCLLLHFFDVCRQPPCSVCFKGIQCCKCGDIRAAMRAGASEHACHTGGLVKLEFQQSFGTLKRLCCWGVLLICDSRPCQRAVLSAATCAAVLVMRKDAGRKA